VTSTEWFYESRRVIGGGGPRDRRRFEYGSVVSAELYRAPLSADEDVAALLRRAAISAIEPWRGACFSDALPPLHATMMYRAMLTFDLGG
jgi:hypothetical protein